MYVLQNEDGKFYWKSDRVSSMHGLKEDFNDDINLYDNEFYKLKRNFKSLGKYKLPIQILLSSTTLAP